eukprot:895895-Rhodomonas_salina.1
MHKQDAKSKNKINARNRFPIMMIEGLHEAKILRRAHKAKRLEQSTLEYLAMSMKSYSRETLANLKRVCYQAHNLRESALACHAQHSEEL